MVLFIFKGMSVSDDAVLRGGRGENLWLRERGKVAERGRRRNVVKRELEFFKVNFVMVSTQF